MLPHEEYSIGSFHLLLVKSGQRDYRLYVSADRENYCHYDSGEFKSLKQAAEAARTGFNPAPFFLFPYAPFTRKEVLETAPHGFDSLSS